MYQRDRPNGREIDVAILLIPEYSQLVLTLLEELLRISNLVAPDSFKSILCSLGGVSTHASNGRPQVVNTAMRDVSKADVIVVCASYNPTAYLDEEISSWLRTRGRHGAMLCGVDTGTLFLADAGLLKGRTATLHWDDLHLARHRYPDATFTSSLFERDGSILTSCGSLSTIDFALELITAHLGRNVADKVSDLTIHDRSEREEPYSNRTISKAIGIMHDNIQRPISIARVARAAAVSERHLSRLFDDEFGRTPSACYADLRLETAQALVLKTRFSLSEIAHRCGFGSQSYFSKCFKQRYSVSPTEARDRSKQPIG